MTPAIPQTNNVNLDGTNTTKESKDPKNLDTDDTDDNKNDQDSNPAYELYNKIPKNDQHRIEDLHSTPNHKPQVLQVFPPLTYLVYIQRVLRNVFITLAFEWTMPIFHPFNFLLLVTVFPTLIILIIILEIALNIGLNFGLDDLTKKIANKWGAGLSVVNWWDPRIFSPEMDEIVKGGINSLNAPLPPPVPEDQLDDSVFGVEGSMQRRSFHLDIAELLLFMSSIIYERNDKMVREVHDMMDEIVERGAISISTNEINSITQKLRESEKRIHQQADQWELKFISLSELNSLGGPFSGIFWSEKHSFIVVVFKGTTPNNFEDFVVDLMFQRTDARGFVFGEVHEGFYTSLFPLNENYTTRSSRSSPYISIVRAIRAKAADIMSIRPSSEDGKKINVWVTGHSLGAALASLFYARLIKSPGDLGPNCILRDGYMFGSPSVGDADFAAEFASYTNQPYDRQSTLWRIIDDIDIITKLPPGWNDPSIRRLVDKSSILNYAHVGEGIRFFQNGNKPVSTRNLFSSGKEPVIIDSEKDDGISGWYKWHGVSKRKNERSNSYQPYQHPEGSPLAIVEKLLPTFFKNHLPARYFAAMEKARYYFDGLTYVEEESDRGVQNKNFGEFIRSKGLQN